MTVWLDFDPATLTADEVSALRILAALEIPYPPPEWKGSASWALQRWDLWRQGRLEARRRPPERAQGRL